MLQDPRFWQALALAVPIYWLLPLRWRHSWLALASFAYLATIDLASCLALGAWALVFFAATPLLRPGSSRQRAALIFLILGILGFLAYYKYVPPILARFSDDPVAQELILPLGISYSTFKLIHYAAEVARGVIREHSFASFAAYMFLFPIFTAGPIERFDHFMAHQDSSWDSRTSAEGLTRVLHGLVKKFLFAELIRQRLYDGRITPLLLGTELETFSSLDVWRYTLAFYAYVYLDFSAYSDIALGASRLFGIRVTENFRWPVVAHHIREYWRRWHISLSQWCQSYVYMPLLGLYRKPLISLYGTFFVMGLWHEGTLTRIAWGLYHATGVALYSVWARHPKRRSWKFLDRPWARPVGIVLTQLFVAGSMCFLILDNERFGLAGAMRLLGKLTFVSF